ncbi:hypothetical protein [Streptomyces sp. NBC_00035]|uniref:hypothetical protein n=1 Tax=Streptomyces sp. NBC_00035 TaxID=2903614 RepID=UPI0032487D58
MRSLDAGETVVRRDVHRSGRVWSEQALRVVADTGEALFTACAMGAEAMWLAGPVRQSLYRRSTWCST